MNGIYDISLRTPMGLQRGRLELRENNGELCGSVAAMGRTNPFSGGRCDGANFAFRGALRTGFMRIDYMARGTVENGVLTAVAGTKYGTWRVEGREI